MALNLFRQLAVSGAGAASAAQAGELLARRSSTLAVQTPLTPSAFQHDGPNSSRCRTPIEDSKSPDAAAASRTRRANTTTAARPAFRRRRSAQTSVSGGPSLPATATKPCRPLTAEHFTIDDHQGRSRVAACWRPITWKGPTSCQRRSRWATLRATYSPSSVYKPEDLVGLVIVRGTAPAEDAVRRQRRHGGAGAAEELPRARLGAPSRASKCIDLGLWPIRRFVSQELPCQVLPCRRRRRRIRRHLRNLPPRQRSTRRRRLRTAVPVRIRELLANRRPKTGPPQGRCPSMSIRAAPHWRPALVRPRGFGCG